jgi:hypothetical protein
MSSQLLFLLIFLLHIILSSVAVRTEGDSFSLEAMADHARVTWIRAKREEARLVSRLSPSPIDPNAPVPPNPPLLPNRFKAKGKASVQYQYDNLASRDLLAIYHYDYPSRKSRLDMYFVHQQNITRYFTDIRDYKKMIKHMIFHRIHGHTIPLSSPHSCLIVPLKHPMMHPNVLRDQGRWVATKDTEMKKGNVSLTVPTNMWEIVEEDDIDGGGAAVWHYYTSVMKGEPVRLVRHEKNVDVHFIDFQAAAVHPIAMFLPERVSKVKCIPYSRDRWAK